MKDPTEELTEHILFTLVVGYFACAQYDVLFIPYRHFVPRNDTIKLKYAPGGIAARRIYVFVKKLNVETEKHHVAVFHNVVLALGTDFAQFLGFYVTAAV